MTFAYDNAGNMTGETRYSNLAEFDGGRGDELYV